MDKKVHVCKSCGNISITQSAYDLMSELDKASYVAKQKAQEFLEAIADGYDQDHAPLFGTTGEKLQSPDVREIIPVVSDVNISNLQKLFVDFFQRNINIEFKEETTNGTKND